MSSFYVMGGCALIPEVEQFVSAEKAIVLSRSDGNCEHDTFAGEVTQKQKKEEGLSPDNLSMLNWNIYKGQRSGWQEDFVRFSKTKDIILLQEAALSDELQGILQRYDLYWNFNSAFKYKGVETGVLVASLNRPLESCGLRLKEPLTGLPKTMLVSSYTISGFSQKLLVANIHGINITLGTGAYKKQFDALQRILQEHDGPIILAGDFNNWTDGRTAIIDHLVKELSLLILPFDDETRTNFFGDPVDHILYRGLKPVAHNVHSVVSSDHNPITVAFRLDNQPPVKE